MATSDEKHQLAREKLSILRILGNSSKPIGSQSIARLLNQGYGIVLSERAVRYHLGMLDEAGFTTKVSRRDGRRLTELGQDELNNAMVAEKVGFVIDKIELLAYQTTFDPAKKCGLIPINFSLIPREKWQDSLKVMAPVFKAGLCASQLVAVVKEGDRLNGPAVPPGYIGLATVCSIVVNGVLLKDGVPMDSRFAGLLQFNQGLPWRFTDLIQYSGSSLDPSEIFVNSGMTSISQTTVSGNGKILANFREVPAVSLPLVSNTIDKLIQAGITRPLMLGEVGRPACEMPVGQNKIGMVLIGGLNPVAAAVEAGVCTINKAMSRVIDFKLLKSFWDL
jgi:repressor of nif and glnA expression